MRNIEWKSIFIVIFLLILDLIFLKLMEKKTNINSELKRKLFHVSMGIVMLIFPYIFRFSISVFVLAIFSLIILVILKNTKLKDSFGTILYSVNRESLGEIFFVISVLLIFYLSKGDKILYSIPILVLTFADSSAALIGKNYGKRDLAEANEDTKSLEGSFIFFIVAFMCSLVPLLLFTNVGREETLIISAIIGFNVSLIEMISHSGNDNILIPITSFALLVTHLELEVEVLRINLLILFAIFIIIRASNKVKAWSKLALVEAFAIGYLTVSLYGIYALIPPIILFLTCMRFPKIGENEKNNLYDARIIETNVLAGIIICAIAKNTGEFAELFMIYALAYSMHLTINTFVRLKYYFNLSEIKCVFYSFIKGLCFIFLPSLIIQKIIFGYIPNIYTNIFMLCILFLSTIFIMLQKRDVKEEKITIKNGYIHMKIVFLLILVTFICTKIF